ncbi:hypothetical protein H2201_003976 [Coniosporium apollinis]|uniref:DUF171-domain-containing protein n=1 Tax=Coniosporium apollinis TaxID=61459 RepID=A0ABQ9NTX9_9PEZI|nr:hypothetical protein H2201_003976 [Coniosporium apollinis]
MATHQNNKKRKRSVVLHQNPSTDSNGLDTSKPTAVFKPSTGGRQWTLSIAVPGSIIASVPTPDLKARLASQIARGASVFCVDEIVVFDDGQSHVNTAPSSYEDPRRAYLRQKDEEEGYEGYTDPDHYLFHVLSYMECPPYLRKELFGFHKNLEKAGMLHSLDLPHHLKAHEWCPYREGVTIGPSTSRDDGGGDDAASGATRKQKWKRTADDTAAAASATAVHTGLPNPVTVPLSIPPTTRLTLRFDHSDPPASPSEPLTATPVDPSAPREERGYYWGYSVRQASSLSAVYTDCPFSGGYDVSIGTSERGVPLLSILPSPRASTESVSEADTATLPPAFNHLILFFGGLAGLEAAVEADAALRERGIGKEKAGEAFDYWVNLVPGQGSRTIRAEEAVWCGLMGLAGYVQGQGRAAEKG